MVASLWPCLPARVADHRRPRVWCEPVVRGRRCRGSYGRFCIHGRLHHWHFGSHHHGDEPLHTGNAAHYLFVVHRIVRQASESAHPPVGLVAAGRAASHPVVPVSPSQPGRHRGSLDHQCLCFCARLRLRWVPADDLRTAPAAGTPGDSFDFADPGGDHSHSCRHCDLSQR